MLDGQEALTTLRYESWEEQVAYIPQDPMIFHASLRENLTFYNPQASDEHLHAAIEKLGLSELLAQLPQGLDTLIGEGARGLSGGAGATDRPSARATRPAQADRPLR